VLQCCSSAVLLSLGLLGFIGFIELLEFIGLLELTLRQSQGVRSKELGDHKTRLRNKDHFVRGLRHKAKGQSRMV